MPMQHDLSAVNQNAREAARTLARSFERDLPEDKRKQLGQFFTGLRLGKLLAHLALSDEVYAILDPMAGHGDLLDAADEAAVEKGIVIERFDAIEIDEETAKLCRKRLNCIIGNDTTRQGRVIHGNAFTLDALQKLSSREYDLVITNPPYVRYQTRDKVDAENPDIRANLETIIDQNSSVDDKAVWKALVKGYSGLADLSIPAWLLSGLFVRPGGRLALVVPATWRSRDYGDVIRYLLLRCFQLEYIVEDSQPGWFSDALVRTQLIIARRLPAHEVSVPLESRDAWLPARLVQIAPDAASVQSLVGAAFTGTTPEADFARWLCEDNEKPHIGIKVSLFNTQAEWATLQGRIGARSWYRELEVPTKRSALSKSHTIPNSLRDLIEETHTSLTSLEDVGINVGQGLRTGCNRFFYVDICSEKKESVQVRASATFNHQEFSIPIDAIRPVLRRQGELSMIGDGRIPPGRVLNLRQWVLPEDAPIVIKAENAYQATGEIPPEVMPDELAAFVRLASKTLATEDDGGKLIPELSAVRTNVRQFRKDITPRFWYMLPDFMPRHLPSVFVARINHDAPLVRLNLNKPILIDANFSTFWSNENWTPSALKALLNSVWCQAFMEALGTPLGGGALKLEATHLKQIHIPKFSDAERIALDIEGQKLTRDTASVKTGSDAIVLHALYPNKSSQEITHIASLLYSRAESLRRMRLKIAA